MSYLPSKLHAIHFLAPVCFEDPRSHKYVVCLL